MADDWPLALFILMISPAVGSFLGVVIERLPDHGVRALLGRSRCAACKKPLRWTQMIPILSALTLRGRCATCGQTFPDHLLRVEIAAFVAALMAVTLTGSALHLILLAGMFWTLIALFYIDLLHFRLPDPLTILLLALVLAWASADPNRTLVNGLASGAIGAAGFWAIRLGYKTIRGREGLGMGDVKLMAGVGAAVGWPMIPWVALLAGLMALFVIGLEHLRRKIPPAKDTAIPFGSYLCVGTVIVLMTM